MVSSKLRHRAATGVVVASMLFAGIGVTGVVSTLTASQANAQSVRHGQPTLYTNDINAMSRFYQAVGFTEIFRFPATGTQFATLQKGNFYLSVVTYKAIRADTGIVRIGPTVLFPNSVTLLTADVDGLTRQALGNGGKPVRPPRDTSFGERQAYIADPAGNLVQISTENGGGSTNLLSTTPQI